MLLTTSTLFSKTNTYTSLVVWFLIFPVGSASPETQAHLTFPPVSGNRAEGQRRKEISRVCFMQQAEGKRGQYVFLLRVN